MQDSLHEVWETVTEPLLRAARARSIIEIGAGKGGNTAHLIAYCMECDGTLHVIDPVLPSQTDDWRKHHSDRITFHADRSLNVLPLLPTADVVIIDGDHNWYTVHSELALLEKHAKEEGRPFPLVILHDTGWPYGRRDLYHDPQSIPSAFQQPWKRGGLIPGQTNFAEGQGLNANSLHAINEHSPQNGVLTAVEDFLRGTMNRLEVVSMPGHHGITFLADADRLRQEPALQTFFAAMSLSAPLRAYIEHLESKRIDLLVSHTHVEHALATTKHDALERERTLERELEQTIDRALLFEREQKKAREYIFNLETHIENTAKSTKQYFQLLIEDAASRARNLEGIIDRMQSTRSWKLTRPLRWFAQMMRRDQTQSAAISQAGENTEHFAFCTIIAKNYLAHARVLAKSIRQHHPQSSIYVLIVDAHEKAPYKEEPFTALTLEDLPIDDVVGMSFQYNITEFCTAVKPWLLQRLLRDAKGVFYLDPDTLLMQPLMEVMDALRRTSIVLTPHLLSPTPTPSAPGEVDVLRSGIYNLGFLGLAATKMSDQLLAWWQDRLRRECLALPERGFFVDQRWMDLVPGFYGEHVTIFRNPGYNVAYWNLHERTVRFNGKDYLVHDVPLTFYHFSGYRPERPRTLSHHVPHASFLRHPDVILLTQEYRKLLLEHGYDECRHVPYGYATFDDGTPIPLDVRRYYLELPDHKRKVFGNPFDTHNPTSFFAWLCSEAVVFPEGTLSQLHLLLWNRYDDLQLGFPALRGETAAAFAQFLRDQPERFSLNERLLPRINVKTDGRSSRPFLRHRNASWFYRLLVNIARGILPYELFVRMRRGMQRMDRPQLVPSLPRSFGVQLLGYLGSVSGVGQVVRATAMALTAVDVPFSTHEVEGSPAPREASIAPTAPANKYPIALIHVNADALPEILFREQKALAGSSYRIGYWAWELEDFPESFIDRFALLHEVWTLSAFSARGIAAVSSIPVCPMPPAVTRREGPSYDWSRHGIAPGTFVALFLFDCLSGVERKNPLGVIEAFERSFRPHERVALVLKTLNADADPSGMRAVRERMQEDARIILIEGAVSEQEVHAMLRSCNVYISLHRAEGFGLTMAEAMAYKKPVIATNYSGNTEFMDVSTACLVGYDLRTLDHNSGPYPRGAHWAEPHIDHASALLRKVFDDPLGAAQQGERAARAIQTLLAPSIIGQRMKRRLEHIAAKLSA